MSFSQIASILAATFGVAGLFALVAPSVWRTTMQAFPRHRLAGMILTAIAVVWVAVLLVDVATGQWERFRPVIYVAAPVSYFLITKYLDELLAPRALGGILLLLAAPILDAARWHPSPLRLVVTVLTYIGIVWGMILVLSPYRFRDWGSASVKTDTGARLVGAALLVLAAVVGYLALRVY